eukprot:CAMPEP_0119070040 /NCGR_PEP_ID=MMETSP1178-20130426/33367_1 /TAXON_ID=33656 /ORGANISM="unid sp, Strain CCMP2000" /LENGTH=157 /DNA_ID=CAMNT_0007051849 /DNA_START=41 /DNA_END=514 /DNA_ORIENTATION=-
MADEGGINLQALSFDQLNQLKQSLEEEMQGLTGAHQQLKISADKLNISKKALEEVEKAPEGTRMLVPITSSLYVPGETAPLDTVLIDVGTGYYIEKSGTEAQAFLDRKIHLITGQAMKVAQAIQIKQEGLQGTVQAMNSKIMAMKQQQGRLEGAAVS